MKWIKGYEGLYEVGEDGTIFSHLANKEIGKGSSAVVLRKSGATEYKMIGRLVAEAYVPNPFDLPLVFHKDGNDCNNHMDNLIWVDQKGQQNQPVVKDSLRNCFVRKYGWIYASKGEERVEARSLREAAEKTGVPKSTIQYALQKGTGQTRQGWYFEREDRKEENPNDWTRED